MLVKSILLFLKLELRLSIYILFVSNQFYKETINIKLTKNLLHCSIKIGLWVCDICIFYVRIRWLMWLWIQMTSDPCLVINIFAIKILCIFWKALFLILNCSRCFIETWKPSTRKMHSPSWFVKKHFYKEYITY